jgi:hypothetical protein
MSLMDSIMGSTPPGSRVKLPSDKKQLRGGPWVAEVTLR